MKKGKREEKYDFSFCMKQNCRGCKHRRMCDEYDQVTRDRIDNVNGGSNRSSNKKKEAMK